MSKINLENIQNRIQEVFEDILKEQSGIVQEKFNVDIAMLDSGLDSLGFAIMVARLEDELGYDPFSEAEEAYYPQTFREFIEYYYNNQP